MSNKCIGFGALNTQSAESAARPACKTQAGSFNSRGAKCAQTCGKLVVRRLSIASGV